MDGRVGMISTRLAIVDPEGGAQPLSDERGRFWVMQNGEIYNYVELREELCRHGHTFATSSDTEVIAHAYEEWGAQCLDRFNGDFAIALWDRQRRELFLARDRFGVRPLFLAEYGGDVCFASEAKALLRHPRATRELDPVGIADTFTLWGTLPDRSAFRGIRELPPAHYALVGEDGVVRETRWWNLEFDPVAQPEEDLLAELEDVLADATKLRLRADVPVAAYVSGGLDSALLAAFAAKEVGSNLLTFGLGFQHERFDESHYQDVLKRDLRLRFIRVVADGAAIARSLPRAVELAEKPMLRTAPAPLLRLSEAVQEDGLKVVLTGEGADELFAGYDIFREDKVRRFWAREPASALRPLLFARLNRFLAADVTRAPSFLTGFYGRNLEALDDPLYSHQLRFANSSRTLRILDRQFLAADGIAPDPAERLRVRLPDAFGGWSPLSRAQYLEVVTFFEGYLLHTQGDRMLMGHSVEGRFPYLDHRVAELATRLPDRMRLRGMTEKYALRRTATEYLPPAVALREKQAYRAPIAEALTGTDAPEYVRELLSPTRVASAGLLDPAAVARLTSKFERTSAGSETDEMALVGSLTLMLLHERLVHSVRLAPPLEPNRLVIGAQVATTSAAVAEALG